MPEGSAPDVGAENLPPLGPVLQKNRWALTQAPGNYEQVPNYGTAAANVAAGTPGTGRGLTKLGKVLSILQSLGQGAMVGSTQPTFGTGALSANAFENQQIATGQEQQQRAMGLQQGQLGLEQARQNLAMMPIYRAMQIEQMRAMQSYRQSQEDLNRAKTERQRQLAGQVGKPFQSGDRMMVYNPDSENADENGYVDVGPAKTAAAKPEKVTPEQETFDYYTRPVEQGGKGYTPGQAFAAMHPHEWQQQPGGGGGANMPPLSMSDIQGRVSKFPPDLQAAFSRLNPQTQESLLKLADGDLPKDAWSPRGTYKNIGGLTQEQATGWASAIANAEGRKWNAQMYGNKNKLYERYNNGDSKEGGQINAFNNFFLHAGDAEKVIDRWDNERLQSGVPWINTPINKLRDKLAGDPLYSQLIAALAPVKKEYMNFLNANRAEHSQDIEEMNKIMNDTETPAQLRDVLKQLGKTAVLRLDSLNETYRTGTGGQDFPNLIHPKVKSDPGVMSLGFGDDLAKYGSGGFMPGYAAPQGPAQAAPAAPPSPTTHNWSATAWSAAHPGEDVKAAIAAARQQGFNVLP